MENPQEFLENNLEELKALQIDEVKVICGIKLKGDIKVGCIGCCFFEYTCHAIGINKESIASNCLDKDLLFGFVELDDDDNLEN